MTDLKFKPFVIDEKNRERFEKWTGPDGIAKNHKNGHFVTNPEKSFTPLGKPLSECRVALVSTGGVHLANQPPYDLLSHDGDWSSREIPGDTPDADFRFSHSHYDTSEAEKDPNCMFPLARLRDLANEGYIGGASSLHIGMMGFVPAIENVLEKTGPEVAQKLIDAEVDAVLLTPG